MRQSKRKLLIYDFMPKTKIVYQRKFIKTSLITKSNVQSNATTWTMLLDRLSVSDIVTKKYIQCDLVQSNLQKNFALFRFHLYTIQIGRAFEIFVLVHSTGFIVN